MQRVLGNLFIFFTSSVMTLTNLGCMINASITNQSSQALQLELLNSPTVATSWSSLHPNFELLINEPSGLPLVTNEKVLVEIIQDPTGQAQLYGTTQIDVVNGRADLSQFAIDLPGVQYVLRFSILGQSLETDPFDIISAAVTVEPFFPINGANFMDYVPQAPDKRVHEHEDRNDFASSIYMHGGEIRKIILPDFAECDDLILEEALGLFHWQCNDEGDKTFFYSRRFKEGKGLRDALNSNSFKQNNIVIKKGSVTVAESALATWWTNPVTPLTLNSGGADSLLSLNSSGTIYTVSSSGQSRGIQFTASKVALVTLGANTIISNTPTLASIDCESAMPGTDNICFISGAADSGWLEVKVNQTNPVRTISIGTGQSFGTIYPHWRIHNSTITSTNTAVAAAGLYIGSTLSTITDSTILSDGFFAIRQQDGDYSRYDNNKVSSKNGYGLYSNMAENLNISRTHVFNCGEDGVSLFGFFSSVIDSVFSNNSKNGIDITSSYQIGLFNNITNNNSENGINLIGVDSDLISGNISFGNQNGLYRGSHGTSPGGIRNNIFSHNSLNGLHFDSTSKVEISNNLIQFQSGNAINISGTSTDLTWTDQLILFGNSTNCVETSSGANPGLIGTTCANQGSSTATLTTGTDTSDYLTGATADSTNTSADPSGTALASTISDWTTFVSPFVSWIRSIPSNVLRCNNTDTCQIFNFTLKNSATLARNINGVPTPNQTCPASVHGNESFPIYFSTALKNAVEITGDLIGDDNGFCESHEDCYFQPHIGLNESAHWNEMKQCVFEDGPDITNVRIYFKE